MVVDNTTDLNRSEVALLQFLDSVGHLCKNFPTAFEFSLRCLGSLIDFYSGNMTIFSHPLPIVATNYYYYHHLHNLFPVQPVHSRDRTISEADFLQNIEASQYEVYFCSARICIYIYIYMVVVVVECVFLKAILNQLRNVAFVRGEVGVLLLDAKKDQLESWNNHNRTWNNLMAATPKQTRQLIKGIIQRDMKTNRQRQTNRQTLSRFSLSSYFLLTFHPNNRAPKA